MAIRHLLYIYLALQCAAIATEEYNSIVWNPFAQHLPDCRKSYPIIKKKTSKKAIVCPMIRDEQGFLAEWIAYHEMHGFDHIIVFDHGSSDNYTAEIQPWLASGTRYF